VHLSHLPASSAIPPKHAIANVGFLGFPLPFNLFHPAAPRGGIGWGFGDDALLANIGITTVCRLIGSTLLVVLSSGRCPGAKARAHDQSVTTPLQRCQLRWRKSSVPTVGDQSLTTDDRIGL
jgi:hypothetical protein